MVLTFFVIFATGCTSSNTLRRAVGKTLQAVGLEASAQKQPSPLVLHLHAGANLNSGNDKKPSAVVVRIYRLRGTQRFEQAPLHTFLNEAAEKNALGDDLISVREVVMSPGVQQDIEEAINDEVAAVGAVALFRAPAENRWRLLFDATNQNLLHQGVTIGLHACALTTGDTGLLSKFSGAPDSLASITCLQTR